MSYDTWKLRSDMDDAILNGQITPEDDREYIDCHQCGASVLAEGKNDDAYAHLGAWYCSECYFALPEVIEEQELEAAIDREREDYL